MEDDKLSGGACPDVWPLPPSRFVRGNNLVEVQMLLAVLTGYERTLATFSAELAAPQWFDACSLDERATARLAEAWTRIAHGRTLVAEGRRLLSDFLCAQLTPQTPWTGAQG